MQRWKKWEGPSTSFSTSNMDPYVYPGTNVLKNLRDIRNAEALSQFEAMATTRRGIELEHRRLAGAFDSAQLRAIHRYIFQDVFDWAGEFRTVNISKSGDSFAFHEYIVPTLNKTFDDLRNERHLGGSYPETFARRAAYYLGEINAIHPFREGNGRAQREFIRQFALHNGLLIDWTCISQEQMIQASRRSLRVDNLGLEDILGTALTSPGAPPASSPS